VVSALTGLASGFVSLLAFRLLLGMMESANWPGVIRMGKITQYTGSFSIPMQMVATAAVLAAIAGWFVRVEANEGSALV
jgi:hypothetical protein